MYDETAQTDVLHDVNETLSAVQPYKTEELREGLKAVKRAINRHVAK